MVFIILFIILLLTRICGILLKTEIIHDEVIAFISATGNQEAYHEVVKNKTPPYGKVVLVSEWKKLWTQQCMFCFKKIQSDLVDYDLHPPLYFWLLHLLISVFGVHGWTGLILNFFIELLTAIILYRFTFQLLNSREKAFISIIIWGFLPSTIDTFMTTRQYSLFIFFSLLLIYSIYLFMRNEKNSIWNYFISGFSICMGMLTFYYFVFIIAGCGIWILLKCRKDKRKKIVQSIVILLCSLFCFYIIHPECFKHLEKISQIREGNWGLKEFFFRLGAIGVFFSPHRFLLGIRNKTSIMFILSLLFLILFVTFISLIVIKRKSLMAYLNKTGSEKKYLIFILLWIFLYNILLYISFITPEHAMTGRYLSIINPLIALLIVMFVSKKKVLNLIFIIVISTGIISILAESFFGMYLKGFKVDYYKKNTHFIILDNIERGYLPRFLWYMPENIFLIAATEEELINSFSYWQQYIDSHSLFLSNKTNKLYDYLINNSDFKPERLPVKLFFSVRVYAFNDF
ncbi:MAG: glycosyltransferase family 39 protein [Spirochaetales bacterium]|nr:glycosyltransferase family 39 protein [Spirochaetales bacterium]